MFYRIARAVEVLQRRRSFPRRDTNDVIPEQLVAQASAKRRLRYSDLYMATWLSYVTDFEDATRRMLKLYDPSHYSRCGSAATFFLKPKDGLLAFVVRKTFVQRPGSGKGKDRPPP